MPIPDIRETLSTDWPDLQQLYPAVFPDEDLLPVVEQLLAEKTGVLSLAAIVDHTLVGHVVFTLCGVEGSTERVGLLGPLGVSPDVQKQGIGSSLVYEGLQRLKDTGVFLVYVLGDPNYYGRFGFVADSAVKAPYTLPDDWLPAWQSLSLSEEAPALHGTLSVPAPWQRRALWVD